MCVFLRNDYEPDVAFFGAEKSRRIEPDTLKVPVPDFIVEILPDSTTRNDRGVKFDDYAAHGVGEYWIIAPQAEGAGTIRVAKRRVRPAAESGSGEVASQVVAGFRIPMRALFDASTHLATLRGLLA